jgi:hypothetical protein
MRQLFAAGAMTIDVRNVTAQTDATSLAERRRLGRANVSPTLIELLRTPAKDDVIPDDLHRTLEDELPIEVDPIAPARGIALAVTLSVPIWAAIGTLAYAILK